MGLGKMTQILFNISSSLICILCLLNILLKKTVYTSYRESYSGHG